MSGEEKVTMLLSADTIREMIRKMHASEMDGQFPNDFLEVCETCLSLYDRVAVLERQIDYFVKSFPERMILWDNAMSELNMMDKSKDAIFGKLSDSPEEK